MIKVKLELNTLTDDELINALRLVVTKMTGNGDFPTPEPALIAMTGQANAIEDLIGERDALLQAAQEKTLLIRSARDAAEVSFNSQGDYVQRRVAVLSGPLDPDWRKSRIVGAGMQPEDDRAPVGPMPKITGFVATQGDSDGDIDMHWNAIKRGLKSYGIERTTDPAGQTGWGNMTVATKSSATLIGLVSGTRYWFRVCAIGSAGPGPWSDAATKVAP